jgi:hypothetical protein
MCPLAFSIIYLKVMKIPHMKKGLSLSNLESPLPNLLIYITPLLKITLSKSTFLGCFCAWRVNRHRWPVHPARLWRLPGRPVTRAGSPGAPLEAVGSPGHPSRVARVPRKGYIKPTADPSQTLALFHSSPTAAATPICAPW